MISSVRVIFSGRPKFPRRGAAPIDESTSRRRSLVLKGGAERSVRRSGRETLPKVPAPLADDRYDEVVKSIHQERQKATNPLSLGF